MPVWLAWVTVALAVLGLISPISYVPTIGVALWSVVVGVLLLKPRAAA